MSATCHEWLYLFSTRHECFTSDFDLTRTRLVSRVFLTSLKSQIPDCFTIVLHTSMAWPGIYCCSWSNIPPWSRLFVFIVQHTTMVTPVLVHCLTYHHCHVCSCCSFRGWPCSSVASTWQTSATSCPAGVWPRQPSIWSWRSAVDDWCRECCWTVRTFSLLFTIP